ncbi:DUF6152 family protein [Candidatus Rariloculus sp.]|uniref:DUF6152 family protein n=1 Tax=Candidatus Rariloculus sp. TaxID=3101265 RepID=UPI003D0A896C
MQFSALPKFLAVFPALALVLPAIAFGHHSRAIYDNDNPVELTGTVVEWQFTNPHCFIILETTDANGESTVWSLEGSNTAGLFRRGWTPDTLKPGDKIMLTARLLRSGAHGGSYGNARWTDGTPIDPRADRSSE